MRDNRGVRIRLVLLAQTLYGDMDTYREISENVVYIML